MSTPTTGGALGPASGQRTEGRLGRALLTNDVLTADVLVVGGGPAGAWAAVSAAETGARVILADKGWLGASGAAAAGGNNLWYLPPDGPSRAEAIEHRERAGGHLSDRTWMHRVLDLTWHQVNRLAEWGYPFPSDAQGRPQRSSLQGPQYMRQMRRQVLKARVTVLDHCPATQLLVDGDGVVSGAAGLQRQRGDRAWTVRAGAVVLATGGCAFLSGALGCNTNTGDGHLMAAELGAELSGMEFSNNHGLAPAFGAQTKGRFLQFARWYDRDGNLLDAAAGFAGRDTMVKTLLREPVFARLDLAPVDLRETLRWSQPNFFLPYEKAGIDPFTQLFEIRLVNEATVRGTGGLDLVGDGCETTVPGLYAAGDAATRELISGGVSGGGSHNGAWAISSGTISGRAAAGFAARGIPDSAAPAGQHGIDGRRTSARPGHGSDPDELVRAVQTLVRPEVNLLRTGPGLRAALDQLDGLWTDTVPQVTTAQRPQRAREAVAMVAHARWMYTAALARTESRAMHVRLDHPDSDPTQARRLRVRGLDHVETIDGVQAQTSARAPEHTRPQEKELVS